MRHVGGVSLFLALLCAAGDALAQGEAGFETPGETAPGAAARVGVRLAGAQGAGALDVEASYDPAVLAFDGAEPGPLAVGAMVEAREPRPGQVRLALVLSEGLAGDGVVCWLLFRAIGPAGTRSALTFGRLEAWHADTLGAIPLRVTAGEVRVAGGAVPPAVAPPVPPPAPPPPAVPPPVSPPPAGGSAPAAPAASEKPEDQQSRVVLILGGLVAVALLFGVISKLRRR